MRNRGDAYLLYAKILIKFETTKLIVIISKVVKMNN